jgi:hypothetical protein
MMYRPIRCGPFPGWGRLVTNDIDFPTCDHLNGRTVVAVLVYTLLEMANSNRSGPPLPEVELRDHMGPGRIVAVSAP